VNSTGLSQSSMREGIADYSFIRALGTGNNGVFYLARRPERLPVSDDLVAVKVLSGTSSQDTFRRATRELAAFAAVNSPYLVTLYDAGQAGSEMYYSLEYVAGGSLADPAEQPSRSAVLAAVAHAARAAHALHEAGMAHNDIKPGNVLLDSGGGKLTDLGLSRLLRPGLTITGLGSSASVEFLDPALIRGAAPSRASDIFALGATLHRSLTGSGLYGNLPRDNTMVAMRRVLSRDAEISASLDAAARAVIGAAISTDQAERPAIAEEFARQVEALAAVVPPL
jgi:eukaryotic-like serine/threonine-protein kinase